MVDKGDDFNAYHMHARYMENKFKKGFLFGSVFGGISVLLLFGNRKFSKAYDEIMEDVKERVKEISAISQDTYEKIVDEAVRNYANVSKVSSAFLENIRYEIKKRWYDIQIFLLYSKIKTKLKKYENVTKEKFYETVEEVLDEEYVWEDKFKKNSLVRRLRSKWNNYVSDRDQSDQE